MKWMGLREEKSSAEHVPEDAQDGGGVPAPEE